MQQLKNQRLQTELGFHKSKKQKTKMETRIRVEMRTEDIPDRLGRSGVRTATFFALAIDFLLRSSFELKRLISGLTTKCKFLSFSSLLD